jgi:hypothetical protein
MSAYRSTRLLAGGGEVVVSKGACAVGVNTYPGAPATVAFYARDGCRMGYAQPKPDRGLGPHPPCCPGG